MADTNPRLREAYQALKDGHKQEARALLHEVLRQNPEEWRAWLWLSGVAPSARASLEYIRRAESLNPSDPTIARARNWAEKRVAQENAEAAATARPTKPAIKKAQPSTPARRSSRRYLVVGALALLIVLLLAGGFVWNQRNGSKIEDVAAAGAAPATAQTAPTSQSGYFAPLNPASVAEPTAVLPTATPHPLSPKAIASEKGAPRARWTATPTPTSTPTPSPTPAPTFVSEMTDPQPVTMRPNGVGPNERWIDVNLTQQRLVAYEGNTPVYESLVSSGTWNHPTVTGLFRVWLRFESQTMDGRRLGYDYYLPDVPFVMYFYQDYALHGTYWHNNFGTPMSHGCVNLPNEAAEWLFYWSSMGTVVNVHY